MARFRFPLERVAAFRRTQADLERAKLEKLQATLSATRRSRMDLGQERLRAVAALARPGAVWSSWSVQTVDGFTQYADEQMQRLSAHEARQELEIAQQQRRVVESERKCELLGKLEERQREVWRQGQAKELEEVAGDSFLAAWNRRARSSRSG